MAQLNISTHSIYRWAVTGVSATAIVLMVGCSSTGTPTSVSLADAQSNLASAAQDDGITGREDANEMVTSAEALLGRAQNEKLFSTIVDEDANPREAQHLAYQANQQVDTARALAAAGASEQELARLQQDRDQAMLAFEERDKARRAEEEAQRLAAQRQREREAELTAALDRAKELGAEVDRSGSAIEVTFRNVTFELNKAQLHPEFATELKGLAETLATKFPKARLAIEGHTDSTGPAEFNKDLSQRRAEAVSTFLIDNGISPDRLSSEGKGESQPLVSNDTREGRARNRRVELTIVGTEQQ